MSSYSNDIDSSFDDNDSYYENSQCYDGDSYSDDECSVESYSADSSPPLQISVPVNINININCPSNDCENDVNDDDSASDDNSDKYDDANDVISDSNKNDSREEVFQDDNDSANINSNINESMIKMMASMFTMQQASMEMQNRNLKLIAELEEKCDNNSDQNGDADDTFSCSDTDDSREEDSCDGDFQDENERTNEFSSPPEIAPPTKVTTPSL